MIWACHTTGFQNIQALLHGLLHQTILIFFNKPSVNLNHRRANTRLPYVVLHTRCSIVSSPRLVTSSLSQPYSNNNNQGVTNLFLRLYTINKRFHHCSTVYSKGKAGIERMLSPVRNVPLMGNYSQTRQDEYDACISETYMFHTLN